MTAVMNTTKVEVGSRQGYTYAITLWLGSNVC